MYEFAKKVFKYVLKCVLIARAYNFDFRIGNTRSINIPNVARSCNVPNVTRT
jgi:hypothetical protein